jgi:hypothetical protein
VDRICVSPCLKSLKAHGLIVKPRAPWLTTRERIQLDRIACYLYLFMTIF